MMWMNFARISAASAKLYKIHLGRTDDNRRANPHCGQWMQMFIFIIAKNPCSSPTWEMKRMGRR
jgi:hypothetical protein